MESEFVSLPVPDVKQVPFPGNWNSICNACRLLWLLDWAESEGLVVTIFPAVIKKMNLGLSGFGFPRITAEWAEGEYESGRLQFYLHPPEVEIPVGVDRVPVEFSRYWVCSFRSLRMICECEAKE